MNINYHGFQPHLGYGIAAKGYVKLMHNLNHNVNFSIYQFEDKLKKTIEKEFEHNLDLNFIHLTPNYIPKVYQENVPNLLNTVFETNKVPIEWKTNIAKIDKIAVPCTWNQKVFENELNRKVYLLPHLSQFEGKAPQNLTSLLDLNNDTFVFLTVATWERRKNLEMLVDAFCKAFTDKDKVVLIIKTSKNNISNLKNRWYGRKYIEPTDQTLKDLLKDKKKHPKIELLNNILTDNEMQSLYFSCNAYVTLTHGEGWGMGAYEAAWYGKPIIATNYGGYLDFLNERNSYLIPSNLIDYKKNFWDVDDRKNHQYANPNFGDAIDLMKYVFQNYERSLSKANLLRNFVNIHFNQTVVENYLHSFIAK